MQRIAYISFYLLLSSCDLIDEDPPGAPFGLKGYFTTVTISTDTNTDPGGMKEIFAVSSQYNISSY